VKAHIDRDPREIVGQERLGALVEALALGAKRQLTGPDQHIVEPWVPVEGEVQRARPLRRALAGREWEQEKMRVADSLPLNHFFAESATKFWMERVTELTQKAVRRGAFVSVAELKEAIEQFLRAWNEAPRPFVWTATVEKIMAKVERARQRLEGIKPGWSVRKKRKKRRKYV